LHIKKHLAPVPGKPRHTYFRQGTAPHNDIVGFIDEIFVQLKEMIDLNVQNEIRPSDIGNINVEGQPYQVNYGYAGTSKQHVFKVIPADDQPLTNYKANGTNSAGSDLYGYQLTISHNTQRNITDIQTFHLL
jgi:hypothetical protein